MTKVVPELAGLFKRVVAESMAAWIVEKPPEGGVCATIRVVVAARAAFGAEVTSMIASAAKKRLMFFKVIMTSEAASTTSSFTFAAKYPAPARNLSADLTLQKY